MISNLHYYTIHQDKTTPAQVAQVVNNTRSGRELYLQTSDGGFWILIRSNYTQHKFMSQTRIR